MPGGSRPKNRVREPQQRAHQPAPPATMREQPRLRHRHRSRIRTSPRRGGSGRAPCCQAPSAIAARCRRRRAAAEQDRQRDRDRQARAAPRASACACPRARRTPATAPSPAHGRQAERQSIERRRGRRVSLAVNAPCSNSTRTIGSPSTTSPSAAGSARPSANSRPRDSHARCDRAIVAAHRARQPAPAPCRWRRRRCRAAIRSGGWQNRATTPRPATPTRCIAPAIIEQLRHAARDHAGQRLPQKRRASRGSNEMRSGVAMLPPRRRRSDQPSCSSPAMPTAPATHMRRDSASCRRHQQRRPPPRSARH